MQYLVLFFAGGVLCNAIPHLASGLRGESFPTPFAEPRGRGPSPAFTNFIWGAFNVVVGLILLSFYPASIGLNGRFIALVLGAVAIGTYLSLHFAAVRRGEWKS